MDNFSSGPFRDECLNEEWFVSLAHARAVIEDWRTLSTVPAISRAV